MNKISWIYTSMSCLFKLLDNNNYIDSKTACPGITSHDYFLNNAFVFRNTRNTSEAEYIGFE